VVECLLSKHEALSSTPVVKKKSVKAGGGWGGVKGGGRNDQTFPNVVCTYE
jgi:hypothetical protein